MHETRRKDDGGDDWFCLTLIDEPFFFFFLMKLFFIFSRDLSQIVRREESTESRRVMDATTPWE